MQARLERRPDAMLIRRQTVEHPFGTLKSWMGSAHFLTKTLEKVRTEMSLHVLAYNMKRMMADLRRRTAPRGDAGVLARFNRSALNYPNVQPSKPLENTPRFYTTSVGSGRPLWGRKLGNMDIPTAAPRSERVQRNVSTTLRQPAFEFRLGFSAFGLAG